MSLSLDDIPKKVQYMVIDSKYVNGSNNTFSVNLTLESNTHIENMNNVLGIKNGRFLRYTDWKGKFIYTSQ